MNVFWEFVHLIGSDVQTNVGLFRTCDPVKKYVLDETCLLVSLQALHIFFLLNSQPHSEVARFH